MDDLSVALTKAISNLLEQTEKRFSNLQEIHVDRDKTVESLQTKVDNLETKCRELIEENAKIKRESIEENDKLRKEFTEENAKIRHELIQENANMRKELTEENARIKKELTAEIAKIGQKLIEEGTKFELKFTEENVKIALDFKTSQNEQEKEIAKLKSTLVKQHKELDDCIGWAKCVAAVYDQVLKLEGAREKMETQMKEFEESLTQLVDKTERYQQSSLIRKSPMVKSPSASSYLNGNSNYNFPSKSRSHTFRGKNFVETFDVDEDISELSDQAGHLLREVGEVNELQRSFEKNSMYSDD